MITFKSPTKKAIRKLAIQKSISIEEVRNSPPLIDEALRRYNTGINFLTFIDGKNKRK
jgi:hypothetical protein